MLTVAEPAHNFGAAWPADSKTTTPPDPGAPIGSRSTGPTDPRSTPGSCFAPTHPGVPAVPRCTALGETQHRPPTRCAGAPWRQPEHVRPSHDAITASDWCSMWRRTSDSLT
jgi:hypothetical protein